MDEKHSSNITHPVVLQIKLQGALIVMHEMSDPIVACIKHNRNFIVSPNKEAIKIIL